jgi:hypothetical protein
MKKECIVNLLIVPDYTGVQHLKQTYGFVLIFLKIQGTKNRKGE